MNAQGIYEAIIRKFGSEAILEFNSTSDGQPYLVVNPSFLVTLCFFLRDEEGLYFDYLANLSGVDYGAKENRMAVVYHLYSLTLGHSIVLKCFLERQRNTEMNIDNNNLKHNMPVLPSVGKVWKAADWHERETYDLLGIEFSEHPDLKRILLPEDWQGFPLRKDYQTQDTYHNIKVDYVSG